jgi:hypothetical protein
VLQTVTLQAYIRQSILATGVWHQRASPVSRGVPSLQTHTATLTLLSSRTPPYWTQPTPVGLWMKILRGVTHIPQPRDGTFARYHPVNRKVCTHACLATIFVCDSGISFYPYSLYPGNYLFKYIADKPKLDYVQ